MERSYNMTYNLTILKEATNIVGLVEFANYATSNIFSGIVVFSLYIILILALKRYDFIQAFISSSFVMFFVSVLLTYAGLMSIFFPLLFISLTAMGALYLYTAGY